MMRSHHAHSDVNAGGLNIGFGVEGSAGAWTDQEDPLANMGFQLPTLDDVLRRGNMVQSFHSAQLLVSFKTKQVRFHSIYG